VHRKEKDVQTEKSDFEKCKKDLEHLINTTKKELNFKE
jgi:hypothetical protein